MEGKDAYAELSSIRDLMERSSKFISLSGLTGIAAGLYALAGAWFAARVILNHTDNGSLPEEVPAMIRGLVIVALAVLVLSIVTSYWLTRRKAKRKNENVWNPVSRRLLVASGIPFLTGGLFIVVLLLRGEYVLIPGACLLFYGLALVAASQFTYHEVRWLGVVEILLGLSSSFFGNGLIFWTIGFSFLHIVYGIYMHFKYER